MIQIVVHLQPKIYYLHYFKFKCHLKFHKKTFVLWSNNTKKFKISIAHGIKYIFL